MFGFRKTMGMKLRSAQRGSVMITVAFGMLAMIGSAGLAVDIGRSQLAQAKLSSALDAAGLAAGASLNTTDLQAEVEKYVEVNFANYLDTNLTDITAVYDDVTSVISVSAEGSIDTTFMRYFGFETMPIAAEAEITRAINGLELVLVLDNTGSMGGSRLTDLKDASHDLIEILYGDGEDNDNLYIGLVPFSQAVNIGSSRTAWLDSDYYDALNWGTTSWAGCVDARLDGGDVTDDPPGSDIFYPYYWPDDGNNDWYRYSWRSGWYYSISSSRTPNKYCQQEVTPMTSVRATLDDAIDDMTVGGNTHVGLGAVWGWRMLSPRWRGLWGGEMDEESLPLDYNTPKMNKAAIIMTDGSNTHSNWSRTAYWYLSDGRLGTTSSGAAVTELNDRLAEVCTSMKNENIVVYTIAFGSPGATIENLMSSCASQPDYYFDSPSGEDLQQAFRRIGDSLSNLRVSR